MRTESKISIRNMSGEELTQNILWIYLEIIVKKK